MIGPVQLAPGEFVDFIPQGGNPELHERFLEVLKGTWQRVPAHARTTILEYYRNRDNWYPRVILGARASSISPIAMGGGQETGFMAWFDSLAILDLPGKETWAVLVVAEELAHAFMTAIQHPSHISDPPNGEQDSQEYRAWIHAKEEAMKEVLYGWPFDKAEHEKIIAWVQSKSVQRKPEGQ
jgi:hypothetical protein